MLAVKGTLLQRWAKHLINIGDRITAMEKVDEMQEIAAIDRRFSEHYYFAGKLYLTLDRRDKAVGAFNAYLEQQPNGRFTDEARRLQQSD